MKNLFTVFKFEFFSLLNKKAFKVTTAIFSIIAILILTVPSVLSSFNSSLLDAETRANKKLEKRADDKFGVIINDDRISKEYLEEKIKPASLVLLNDKKELKKLIASKKFKAGIIITSTDKYEYIINNSSMVDDDQVIFDDAMTEIYRTEMLSSSGMDPKAVENIYNAEIDTTTTVLGDDNIKNYLPVYLLTFGLYFIVLFYGQNTAVSVASEKSNRSMEILVTSTSTESLIFGKVMANALTGIVQFTAIILSALISYKLNSGFWEDKLDFIFDISPTVLISFIMFGTVGYLLYLFVYSAIGALVSRTEDITTSSTPITLVYLVAFFTSIIGLNFPDNIIIKIASFFPFTSFMAMFVRMSMSSVSMIQVAISFVILLATTIFVGIVSAKVYRLGTLMYGNPVKIGEAIKLLRGK